MAYTTFLQEKFDHTEQPMFFGKSVNVARYDRVKYPFLDELTQRQLSFFWRPEEVDISRDRSDFNSKLTDHERHIFTSNLKYQTLLDSVQGRSLVLSLLKVCSLPELENWIETWSFFETIHSRSYSHIIRNLYPDPDVVFDDIIENKYIAERAASVTDRYDRFISRVEHYLEHKNLVDKALVGDEITYNYRVASPGEQKISSNTYSKYGLMRDLYLLLVDIYALEALRFYVSFACSFAFAERNLMEGNAKIIKFIARDENLHKLGTAQILQALQNSEDELWKMIIQDSRTEVQKIFGSVLEQEKEWAAYLFKDGSMIGLTQSILERYMEYTTGMSMAAIGAAHDFDISSNPLPWMDKWIESDSVQVAPQETELSSYLTADLANDLNDLDLGGVSI